MKGGAREGAGRKPAPPLLKKEPISLKLPRWLIDWMDAQPESRAVLIEDAICKRHKIKPPPAKPGLGGDHNKITVPAGYVRAVRLIPQADAGGLRQVRRELLAIVGGELGKGWRIAEGTATCCRRQNRREHQTDGRGLQPGPRLERLADRQLGRREPLELADRDQPRRR